MVGPCDVCTACVTSVEKTLDMRIDVTGTTEALFQLFHTSIESKGPALQHQLVGTNLHIVDRVAGAHCLLENGVESAAALNARDCPGIMV